MWFKTVGGQQFMNSTLPYLMRTLEQLSNNLGRLAMKSERSERLSLGGDLEYLAKLIYEYGSEATVGEVAAQEMARIKEEAAKSMEDKLSSMNDKFDEINKSIEKGAM